MKWSENLDETRCSLFRLSIIDLSLRCFSTNVSKIRVKFVYGEIYNHIELRKEMESSGIKFSTSHSDTSITFEMSEYGNKFIEKVDCQFSVVLLNKITIQLLFKIAFGKALYYYFDEDNFIFSSNLNRFIL